MQAGNDLCGTRTTKNSSNKFIQKWDKAGNKLLMALASEKEFRLRILCKSGAP